MSIDVLVTSSGGRGWEWTPATERRIVRVKQVSLAVCPGRSPYSRNLSPPGARCPCYAFQEHPHVQAL